MARPGLACSRLNLEFRRQKRRRNETKSSLILCALVELISWSRHRFHKRTFRQTFLGRHGRAILPQEKRIQLNRRHFFCTCELPPPGQTTSSGFPIWLQLPALENDVHLERSELSRAGCVGSRSRSSEAATRIHNLPFRTAGLWPDSERC